MDHPKTKFRRALADAADLYRVYLSSYDIDVYCNAIEAGVCGDWFAATVAMKQVIAEHDCFPTSPDTFNMHHNMSDQADHPAWAKASAMSEAEFYTIRRPEKKKPGKKTWPGANNG